MVFQQGMIDFNGLNGASFDTAALPPTHDIRPSRVTAFYGRVSREAVERLERFERLFCLTLPRITNTSVSAIRSVSIHAVASRLLPILVGAQYRGSLEAAFGPEKANSKLLNNAFFAVLSCQFKLLPRSDPLPKINWAELRSANVASLSGKQSEENTATIQLHT